MGRVRLLTEADVTQLLPMSLALETVESVFRWQAAGQTVNKPRVRLRAPKGLLQVMPAAVPEVGAMGLKAYTVVAGRVRFVVPLFSTETGELIGILEADRLGQVRTGAASGVATKYLGRPDADVVGCYGTGYQAETQLEAICGVRRIRRIQVYGRDPERRQRFARTMEERLKLPVVAADRPEEAARGALILVTMTSSKRPVLHGAWLEPGAHINAAGSNALSRREIDDAVVKKCDVITVDGRGTARNECGDLLSAVEKGWLRWDTLTEIGEVIAGKAPGRTSAKQITLYESHGMGLQDLWVGAHMLKLARERNVGTDLPVGH
jgi:ornithine cyclodeaminase/alanine dehydrogenase-like protein (mu-crystallin family)